MKRTTTTGCKSHATAVEVGFIDILAIDAQNLLEVIEYKVKEDIDREALVHAMDYTNFAS